MEVDAAVEMFVVWAIFASTAGRLLPNRVFRKLELASTGAPPVTPAAPAAAAAALPELVMLW